MPIDYTQFNQDGRVNAPIPRKWWELHGLELSQGLFSVVQYLRNNQSRRTTQLLISTRLYGNSPLMGLNGLTYSKLASVANTATTRITYNVCQAVVDTITSKIAKNKPKPLYLTSGGDYKLQRKGQKLTKFMEGVFYENKAHELGVQIFKDACIWGSGILHAYIEHDKICYERVIPTEILVDDIESFYGSPRSLYRTKNVDRSVALAAFPDSEEYPERQAKLKLANSAKPDDLGGVATTSDEIALCEAIHLPSGPDAGDGRHVICIDGYTLFEEEYKFDFFPYVFFHWSKKLFGFWGQSLVEQVQNIQLEINKLLWVIQRSMHLAGSFKILLENGSKIVKEHLNNDIGAIVNYTGVKPEYVTPPIVQPEVYSHLATLKAAAFEQAGISQLSAESKKPEGLDSGAALREYNDIESDRFMVVGQAYEELFIDLANLTTKMAKSYFKSGSYKVMVPDKKFVETIDWKDVNLKEDEYVLKCYPVSALPNEPAGRLATIQEMIQAGLIDPETGKRLLDYPDLEAEEGLSNAAANYLHEIFEKMVDKGLYTPPEPFDKLDLARKLALEYYQRGKCSGLEEEKLDLFRRFISQLDTLETLAMQAAQPPQPQPQAAPEPQPTSNMVPNQPGLSVVPGGAQ